ncbi:rhomboid family intramembrane serine protease [Lactobacillus sp. DCY120]|uniref:Rhomboid family intramembrane serine protease n=1 Tax=Bombilactobacillus apium TaxID=2675299 RepID=A0A850R4M1_9LACO|nr:rhomboid family intramembrane serine protease [Bombilactobacillus apium]NVY96921.1 rhomboid family intramembrane serine protease [Bombilactobacillus apium]
MERFRNTKVAWATYFLLALQIAVFFWEVTHGGSTNALTLVQSGAKVDLLVAHGQWWRLITPMFVHIGWQHLLLNAITLYFIGLNLEPLYGSLRFLILYLLTGIGGNLFSFAVGASGISAGASTALFGLFGLYVALGVTFRENPVIRQWSRQFGVLIILNLGLDLFTPGIDLWGHLGGALTGLGLGLVTKVAQIPPEISNLWRIIIIGFLIIMALGLYGIGVVKV